MSNWNHSTDNSPDPDFYSELISGNVNSDYSVPESDCQRNGCDNHIRNIIPVRFKQSAIVSFVYSSGTQ